MDLQGVIDRLDPSDITQRVRTTDGSILTVQPYRNSRGQIDGWCWACHTCPAFGTDGQWSIWQDPNLYFTDAEPFKRIDQGAASERTARVGARCHASDRHGAPIDGPEDERPWD